MKTPLFLTVYTVLLLGTLLLPHLSAAQSRIIAEQMVSLRRGNIPEWRTFPKEANEQLLLGFEDQPNISEYTLSFRQEDVKQHWRILLNDRELGRLHQDENPMITYWAVAPHMLRQGRNTLRIVQADTTADDIRIGEILLHDMPMQALLSQAKVHITVKDKQTGTLLPSRITITTANHALQTVGAADEQLVLRPGFIYTADGKASFGLPAGSYTIYATRGFEYGVDSLQFVIKSGEAIEKSLAIAREVPTTGWVSADSHIHTFTYSRHGDASLAERAITIAGEGIELPVLTDHNVHVDIDPAAKALQVRRYFTPLIGNEVTTKVGHFNIFPLTMDLPPIDHQVASWQALAENVAVKQISSKPYGKVIILNHARDVHHQFRPFGEDRHIAPAGMNLDKWVLPANAMEIINSGSQQNDKLRLFQDWLAMLNRGYFLTPIGASDSHDVGRYLVGQARTYIQCKDDDPASIDVRNAVDNLLAGKVMVSFGLMAEVKVDNRYGAGDLAAARKEVAVSVSVLGPAWVRADRVSLYANGVKVGEEVIKDKGKAGVKWTGSWKLPVLKQDFHLVAIAEGPGNFTPFWPIAKPYQPTSSVWQPGVMGCSGAVWIDADGDGKRSSAYAYAQQIMAAAKGNMPVLLKLLSAYDEAVALQTAALLHEHRMDLTEVAFSRDFEKAPPAVKQGFKKFHQAWQLSQQAREKQ